MSRYWRAPVVTLNTADFATKPSHARLTPLIDFLVTDLAHHAISTERSENLIGADSERLTCRAKTSFDRCPGASQQAWSRAPLLWSHKRTLLLEFLRFRSCYSRCSFQLSVLQT
jgi:hypothetical protein